MTFLFSGGVGSDALDTLINYISYDFVRNAMIAGLLISLCAGLLGVTLVLKRYSMIGDGLSHVAFGAMAIATVTSMAPMAVAMPVTVLAAIILLFANQKGLIKGDAAIAMLSAGSLAVGYMLLNIFPSGSGNLGGDVCSSLFGSTSMMPLSGADVVLCLVLSVAVLLVFTVCYHRIFAVTFDRDFAVASGVHAPIYDLLIAVVSAIVIVLAMQLVGALLISALIIFPALSSMRLFRNFRAVVISSAVIAVIGSLAGLVISLLFSTPTGASIVVVHIVIFAVCSVISKIMGGVRR